MVSDFDLAAASYDVGFTNSSIGKAQRRRVYYYLDRWLDHESGTVLELNCGTGTDAIYLTGKGQKVTATDASIAMLEQAREKAAGLDIKFRELNLLDLEDPSLQKNYDLLFSNFGGLNCLHPAQLGRFLEQAEKLMAPNGQMILVLMSRSCLLERWYYRYKSDPAAAKRRSDGGPLEVMMDGVAVPTWYYDPKDLQPLLPQNLKLVKAYPIGISIPPSYMQQGMDKYPWMLKLGAVLEPLLATPSLAHRGDHFIVKIERS